MMNLGINKRSFYKLFNGNFHDLHFNKGLVMVLTQKNDKDWRSDRFRFLILSGGASYVGRDLDDVFCIMEIK